MQPQQNIGEERDLLGRQRELELIEDALVSGRQIVLIEGPRAVGKTTLARYFVETHGSAFPEGVCYSYGFGADSVMEEAKRSFALPPKQAALLVVDEAHELPPDGWMQLKHLHDSAPELRILLVSDSVSPHLNFPTDLIGRVRRIAVGGLPRSAVPELIDFLGVSIDKDFASAIYDVVGDRPHFLAQAFRAAQEGTLTPQNLETAIASFSIPGILGPDGKPYSGRVVIPERVVVAVRFVGDELLKKVKANPEIMRDISPRQFEEVIAELLLRQGYDVELTPAVRDGGFDVRAARSDDLGSFLFLVECKRFTPPNKVGVQVIRSLYGTVQQMNATAGIVATTSFFTANAEVFQKDIRHQISLRDFLGVKKWLDII